MRASKLLLAGMLCLALVACGRATLYSDLSEQQANEIVAALQHAGVGADKQVSDRKGAGWEVRVASGEFPRAMDVLAAEGLPREQFASLGELFRKEGFASSALEEKARYMHGVSQDLANTLSRIDGVVTARVHIALPERDPLGGTELEPSASVVLFEQEGANLRERETSIKGIVKDGVEGLRDINNVTVAIFPGKHMPELAEGDTQLVQNAGLVATDQGPLPLVLSVVATALLTLLAASVWRRPQRGGAAQADSAGARAR
ncbi:type III secretion system inner membrane ring lipoprotein SctJ [Coralloluteibacterium stylophorae]|uniref:Lipoprotein n=1 Tax=Coralloluteibacterium stylophorae TaxID=1776034 RepID=A0A8J7VVC4_9GAMM|nr:type III secretion inner membrane ring lipoprotein SctJ [Coralloluteibacterium stylophorae]MBS7458776.1 type III secretion inner membrane ring lipoprotein SctJ [Coralloluteibacterium stylophorae]